MKPHWKPSACACGAKHPTISRTGSRGPWMCSSCDSRNQARQSAPEAQGALL